MTLQRVNGLSRRGLLGVFAAATVAAAPTYSNAFGLLRGAGDIRRVHMISGRSGEKLTGRQLDEPIWPDISSQYDAFSIGLFDVLLLLALQKQARSNHWQLRAANE